MGAVEIHPWGSSIDNIDCPDRMIFDLDPAPDVPFEALIVAAKNLRKQLRGMGLESLPKASGGKGLHVTVPLAGKDNWAEVKAFANKVAHGMVDAAPEAYVATMTKAKRTGKIFIDFFRNDYTATAIADYAVRARSGAPVAVPLEWKELDSVECADQFKIKDVLARVSKKKLPKWPDPQRLPKGKGV
jgi:bifunctional non-homologous end joining protein LigD